MSLEKYLEEAKDRKFTSIKRTDDHLIHMLEIPTTEWRDVIVALEKAKRVLGIAANIGTSWEDDDGRHEVTAEDAAKGARAWLEDWNKVYE